MVAKNHRDKISIIWFAAGFSKKFWDSQSDAKSIAEVIKIARIDWMINVVEIRSLDFLDLFFVLNCGKNFEIAVFVPNCLKLESIEKSAITAKNKPKSSEVKTRANIILITRNPTPDEKIVRRVSTVPRVKKFISLFLLILTTPTVSFV